ncbi:MAG: ZIP family metal transporter [Bacilli bacterium]|nr:ZIP family metal transporter [Bacilli bacterium]
MLEVIIYSTLGLIGTAIGGVLGIFFGKKMLGKTLALTAGIMGGLVIFDIFPLAWGLSDSIIALLSFGIGLLGVMLIGKIVYKTQSPIKENRLINSGMILLLSMALHNFPEGMAIGSGGAESSKTGLIIALTIAMHDIPEGMAVATPFVGGSIKSQKVFFLTILSSLSTILGAVIGYLLGNISDNMNAICLGIAAGAMIAVVASELLPNAFKYDSKREVIFLTILGVIVSIIFIALL